MLFLQLSISCCMFYHMHISLFLPVIISSLTSHLTQAAVAMTSDMTQLEMAAKILLVPHAIIATSVGSYAYQHNCRLENKDVKMEEL